MRNGWEQVINPDDPEWIEHKKEFMTPAMGRVMATVWESGSGHVRASIAGPRVGRRSKTLNAEKIGLAFLEVEDWVQGLQPMPVACRPFSAGWRL